MRFIDNKEKLYKYAVYLILIIGILIRIVGITDMPNALNCDEASAGYEAFSLLNYGIDRNGNHNPSFLVAWGSGQNALLTYLIIPLIKIFGLKTIAIRLPMAILGCVSLVLLYLLLRKISNKKLAIIGLAFFAICPWHIMKSRWGLESNLFPDLILIFAYMLIKGIEDNNKILYYLSFVVAGISAYAYGTSYYFLPVFLIPLLIILIKQKKITIKQAILSIVIVGIVSLPVILYVVINTLNLEQINLPFLTVPKLKVNRYKELTSIFSGEFLKTSTNNLMHGLGILIFQYDGLPWNSIMPFGTMYLFSTFFTIIGIIDSFRKDKKAEVKYSYLFNIWFIVSIILTCICDPNINRINIIMIPIIYYTIIGIYLIVNNRKKVAIGIAILYTISFGLFINKYFKQDCDTYGTFASDLQEVMEYAKEIASEPNKKIYITNKINYIFVLYYTQFDTNDYVKTVDYEDEYVEFRQVNSFGNYYLQSIDEIKNEENDAYIIRKEDLEKYQINQEKFKITEFEKYVVIENK